jgi:4-hydroxyproline epimerase
MQIMSQSPLQIIDSHTEGEPTRVVVSGGPDLGSGSMMEKSKCLR